jgi:aminopeptidase N
MRFSIPIMLAVLLLGPRGSLAAVPPPTKDFPDTRGIAPSTNFNLPAWEAQRYQALSNWPPAETNPTVDITHYDLDLTFSLADTTVSGTATITLTWKNAATNSLHLDLVGLTATSVRKSTGPALAYTQDSAGLDITVTPAPALNEVVTIKVDYNGRSRAFYVYTSASYTFTEPDDSRYWFPCRDVPWDKATLDLHGRVPQGNTLVSNGALLSSSTSGGWTTYNWQETHPLATYLMCASIANYAYVTTPSPVTTLGWYVYPSHTSQAATAFQHLGDMISFFSSTLIPYPFDKYVMCESNLGGGMEHQSATLMGDAIVTAGLNNEWITAHELAHQWFGDTVTLADWRNIWLNEGFATFFEAVWHEHFYGPAAFDQRMLSYENNVKNWQATHLDHPIYDPPPNNIFDTMEYYKAAWVLRMLRDLMGKPAFDAAITSYLQAHKFGNASTQDFQAAMEAGYGASLSWFFDQWIMTGTGRPQLAYVPIFSSTSTGWLAQIDIKQIQTWPTTYRLPLEVRITTTTGTVTVTGWIQNRHDVLAFPVASQPLSVVLDPSNKMLGEVTQGSTTGVPDDGLTLETSLQAFPNPFRSSTRFEVPMDTQAHAIEIIDVQGRRVREILLQEGTGWVNWDGQDDSGHPTPAGVYFARLEGGAPALRLIRLGN